MPSQNGTDAIAVRQESEIQELMGPPPGWILQSGITILFAVVGLALLASWFIRYPDKLTASAVIQCDNPPAELRIPFTGRIDTVFQPDKAELPAGALAAVMESAADWRDMLLLDSLLAAMARVRYPDSMARAFLPPGLDLGALQSAYAALCQNLADLHFFLEQAAYSAKTEALGREVEAARRLGQAYSGQQAFFLKEKMLVEKGHNRNGRLFREGVASEMEVEQSESLVWQYEQKLKNLEIISIQNTIRIRQLEAQALEARHEYENRRHLLRLAVQRALYDVRGGLEEWKEQHLITAPVAGLLELAPDARSHAAVQAGQLLGAVLPGGRAGPAMAYLRLSPMGIGKIEIGAPVKISLAAYPPMEYGRLHATVCDIALSPQSGKEEAVYYVKAALPDTLRTNYGIVIGLQPNMPATAEVITKDRRILERLGEKFLDALKN